MGYPAVLEQPYGRLFYFEVKTFSPFNLARSSVYQNFLAYGWFVGPVSARDTRKNITVGAQTMILLGISCSILTQEGTASASGAGKELTTLPLRLGRGREIIEVQMQQGT